MANGINFFAANTNVANGVTKIREQKYTKIGYTDNFKPKGFSRLTTQTSFGLEYYAYGAIEQYVIFAEYQYVLLLYPSILPVDCVMNISTKEGLAISLNPIFVRNEGSKTCGYFPISEEQLQKIFSGISTVNYDLLISDEGKLVRDKHTFNGSSFSKKMKKFYDKIQKNKTKINIASGDITFNKKSDIVLLYNGYNCDPFLFGEFLETNKRQPSDELWDYYNKNRENVYAFYNSSMLNEAKSVNEKMTAQARQQTQSINDFFDTFNKEFNRLEGERQQRLAVEEAKRKQQQAEMEAIWAKQREQQQAEEYAKRQAEKDRLYGGSNSIVAQMEAEKNRSQNRSMQTSDLAQYNAARMSDATYGTAATNQALSQQRQYDAQQNQQARINEQRMLDQQLGTTENAITSSGARIQIKVKNGVVTAYSTSNSNYSGTGPEWNRVSSPVSRTTDNRYGYEANLVGVGKVFWGESRPVISNQLGGVAVNAVTINGETIQIRVENEVVIAYRKNGNLPWNGQAVSAKKTNVTYDGEQIASRFKYKADLPGIGTVYF